MKMPAESRSEYSGSSIPPKFIGKFADSLMIMLKRCSPYGTSTVISLPVNVKFGRLRPFMNFAAVWESAVMIIGRAIDGSLGTYAVVAPLWSFPNGVVWFPENDGVRVSSGCGSVVIDIAYL